MDAIARVLVAHEGKDVRRLHPQHGIWQIVWPGLIARSRRARIARVQTCRAEVLRELFSTGLPRFIRHPDPPKDYDVPGRWEPRGDDTWVAPSGFQPGDRASASWFALGCWVAYAAPRPADEPWPDVFRLSAEDVLQWTSAHGVRAAVGSFHDDDEWRVVVVPG
jgi:hypothetical protein